ncbi:MAG: CcdB family protein [Phenylobacterium sp.]|nr:CcdB family protein [Phenylobacterium sp.]
MRQFDVIENPSSRSRRHAPYFVVLQSHYMEPLDTVIVAPVIRDAIRALTVLDVPVEVDGETLLLTIGELFAIEREILKTVRASLADQEDAIRRAIGRAFTGF